MAYLSDCPPSWPSVFPFVCSDSPRRSFQAITWQPELRELSWGKDLEGWPAKRHFLTLSLCSWDAPACSWALYPTQSQWAFIVPRGAAEGVPWLLILRARGGYSIPMQLSAISPFVAPPVLPLSEVPGAFAGKSLCFWTFHLPLRFLSFQVCQGPYNSSICVFCLSSLLLSSLLLSLSLWVFAFLKYSHMAILLESLKEAEVNVCRQSGIFKWKALFVFLLFSRKKRGCVRDSACFCAWGSRWWEVCKVDETRFQEALLVPLRWVAYAGKPAFCWCSSSPQESRIEPFLF